VIEIRPLAPGDRAALEALLSEINEHYYGEPRDTASKAAIARELIEDGYCDTLLAWNGEACVGLAIFTFLQPTARTGGTLFLKELFVSAPARSRRLGRAFMARLAAIARDRGCSRLDWTAQRGDPRTMRFYREIGASLLEEKAYFRFTEDEFDALIERLD
jgi:GNAT superfamily N-acetyltransferase